jgi:tetratricopeptide (TPR) repeat protein
VSNFNRQLTLNEARNSLKAGNLSLARRWCQELLAHNASDPDALNTMGSIAMQQGFLDEAETYYERAVKVCPNEAGLQVNLGKVRLQKGRAKEAITAFNKALALKPRMDMPLAAKAEALNYLGDVDNARALLEPIVRVKAESAEMAFVYATLLQQAGEHEAVVKVVPRHLADPSVVGFQRYRLGLLLGKSHESMGDYEQAFEAYQQGNAAGAASSRFNPEQHVQHIDRLIEFFSAQRIRSLPHAANDSELPIFIAGMARSGTTLIEQIIQAHPQAHGGGEVIILDQIVGTMPKQLASSQAYPECLNALTVEAATRFGRAYTDQLQKLAPDAARIVDKNLRNIEYPGLISLLFPRARVIHCRRHALDTCLSCYLSPLSPIKHGYATDLNHLGSYYCQYERLMTHWKAAAETPILEVQYEDLVADQENVSRKIIAFCGLEWDDRCLNYFESKRVVRTLSYDQVRRPIYDKSIGRYTHYERFLGPLRKTLEGGAGAMGKVAP